MDAIESPKPPRPPEAEPRTYSERLDDLEGFWPGVQLALALATLTAVVTVGLLVPWLWLSERGAAGVGIVAAWWALFWLVLSLVLLGGLWLGYRAWEGFAPVARREERAAVDAAAAIIADARRR